MLTSYQKLCDNEDRMIDEGFNEKLFYKSQKYDKLMEVLAAYRPVKPKGKMVNQGV